MTCRKLVAVTSFVLLATGAAFAQTSAADKARTEDLIKQALDRYNEGIQAAQVQSAQGPSGSGAVVGAGTVPLTLDEAVQRAADNNLDIAVEKLNPQTFDLSLAGLYAVYHPVATSRYGSQALIRLPNSLLNGGSRVNNDTLTYNGGIAKAFEWGGGNVAWSWNNSRLLSSDALATFNPQYQSTFQFVLTQPLLKNFRIDSSRQLIQTTRISRDTADLNLKARTVNTLASVRSAYWDYVYSIQAVDVAQQSLALAQKLLSDNRVRVEVGTMAPMDVVQAQAEVATRQQALTTATATMRTSELAVKRLIVSGTNDPLWAQHVNPVDRPEFQPVTIDVESAVRSALQQRTDLQITRNNMASNNVLLKSFNDQKLPQVDLTATYGMQGIGGTQFQFQGSGVNAVKIGETPGGYSDALSRLFQRQYPNKVFQINVTYPIGGSSADASAARQKLLITQNQAQIRASELRVASDVTNAALTVQNNIEGLAAACGSQMANVHQTTRNPDPNAGIDVVGWLFSAVAATIIAVAALIAYEANDTMVAKAPGSQMAAR